MDRLLFSLVLSPDPNLNFDNFLCKLSHATSYEIEQNEVQDHVQTSKTSQFQFDKYVF